MDRAWNNDSSLSEHAKKVEAWLLQVRHLKQELDYLRENIEFLNQRMTSPPSYSSSNTKVQLSSRREADFERLVAIKDNMERELQEKQQQFDRLKTQAEQTIRKYTMFKSQTVLLWYYILGFPWKVVAERVDRTERTIYRIRNEALEKLILPDDAIWLE